jgi:hypothetical protein
MHQMRIFDYSSLFSDAQVENSWKSEKKKDLKCERADKIQSAMKLSQTVEG